jgi:hypothetical protein
MGGFSTDNDEFHSYQHVSFSLPLRAYSTRIEESFWRRSMGMKNTGRLGEDGFFEPRSFSKLRVSCKPPPQPFPRAGGKG